MFLGLQPWLRALARCPHLLSLSRKIPSPDFPSKRRALSPSGPSCLNSPAELGHQGSDSQGHVAKGKLPVSRHCLLCTYLCGCSRFRQPQRQLEPPAPSRPQFSIRAAVWNSVPVIWPRNSRRHKRLSGPTFCIRCWLWDASETKLASLFSCQVIVRTTFGGLSHSGMPRWKYSNPKNKCFQIRVQWKWVRRKTVKPFSSISSVLSRRLGKSSDEMQHLKLRAYSSPVTS